MASSTSRLPCLQEVVPEAGNFLVELESWTPIIQCDMAKENIIFPSAWNMDISFQSSKDQKPMESNTAVGHPVFINHDSRCFGGKGVVRKLGTGWKR